MTERKRESPHYIPELDPENHDETAPEQTMRRLFLEWHTWLVLSIGASPALAGVFIDALPDWTRLKLVAIGVALSLFLVVLLIKTNRPKS